MQVTSVSTVFDGIAELSSNPYTTVMAAVEPIERRPEAAVPRCRDCRDGRLILFGHPTLERLSRKMMQFGCDDYIVTPAKAGEIRQIFGSPRLRLAEPRRPRATKAPPAVAQPPAADGRLRLPWRT